MEISQLTIYPVKSCAGQQVGSAFIENDGLRWDRQFLVVDWTGTAITQMYETGLSLVQPKIESEMMVLDAPGMPTLSLKLKQAGPTVSVVMNGIPLFAHDMGMEAAGWFQDYLGKAGARLVRFSQAQRRLMSNPMRAFKDASHLTFISQATLDLLNKTIHGELTPDRFRANFILVGSDDPREEYSWKGFLTRGCQWTCLGPVERDNRLGINQSTGRVETYPRADVVLSRIVRQVRGDFDRPAFGVHVNLKFGSGATLHAGGKVTPTLK